MIGTIGDQSKWDRVGANLTAHGRGYVFSWYRINRACGADRASARKMACDMAHGMFLGSFGRCTK